MATNALLRLRAIDKELRAKLETGLDLRQSGLNARSRRLVLIGYYANHTAEKENNRC